MDHAPLLTVCLLGRMGDIVAMEPAFRYLHERHPDRKFRWYTREPYRELLGFAPFIDEVVTVSGEEEYLVRKAELPEGTISYEFNFRDPHAPPGSEAGGERSLAQSSGAVFGGCRSECAG